SGVGKAVVADLAKRGYDIALVGRTEANLKESAAAAGKSAGRLVTVMCDVSDATSVAAMARHVSSALGEVDVLVNSAGTNVPRRALAELSFEDYKQIIDINLTGAYLVTQAFLPEMRRRGRGTIVNVISDAGHAANRFGGAAYIASKFGLAGLTDAINLEERKNGIRACGIYPGVIDTPLLMKRPAPPTPEAREKMLKVEDV